MADSAVEVSGQASSIGWKPKMILISAAIGAAVGVTAAMLMISRTNDDQPPKIGVGEGVKLGVLVFGLLRSVATLKD
jgi:hypothetical protein